MPKNTPQRIIDSRSSPSGAVFSGGSGGSGGGVTDHGALTGLTDDDHGQYHNDARGDARYVPLARTVTAGTGLTGGGALSSNITLTPVAPATLTVSTSNSAASHTHAITTSSNPGAAAAILASTSAGGLTLEGLTVNGQPIAAGGVAAYQFDDRAATGSGSRWALYASSGTAYLYRPSSNLWSFSAAGALGTASHMTLGPTDDLILDPGSNLAKTASGVSLQAHNYASQLTGWRVTNDGQGDFRYLFVDEMHAKSFIADLEQALAGGQIISKSVAMVGATFTAPAAGGTATLTVRDLPSAADMAVFQSGDIVRLRKLSRSGGSLTIADCWGVVTSYADAADGLQTWTFTRSSGSNAGTMTTGATVDVDSIALDYGTTGNGYYEVNSIDGMYGANSPYAQIVTWATHPATGQTVRVRTGNLYGLFSVSNEFGMYAGDGTANTNQYLRISSNAVRLNNVPLTLYNGATQTVNIDSAGTNIWVGPSSSDKRLTWDGTTLTIKGQATVKGGAAVSTSGAGLYLGSDRMGYYNGTDWKTSIDSSGNFLFLGSGSTTYIQWVAASNKLSGVSSSTERWKFEPSGLTFLESTDGSGTASLTWRSNALAEKSRMGYASALDQMFWNLSVPLAINGTIQNAQIETLEVSGRLHTTYGGEYLNVGYTQWHAYLYLNAYPNISGTYAQATTGYSGKGRGIQLGDDIKFLRNSSGGGAGATVTPTAQLTIDDSGNLYTPDVDVYGIFGVARVGYVGGYSDVAGFSHRDQSGATTYSVVQSSAGKTVINSASGQTIDFRIANTNVMNAAGTFIEFVEAVISDKYIEWAGTPYSSTDGPGGEFGKIRIFLRNAGTGKYELRWVSKNTANTATRGGVIFDTTEGADIP